MIDMVRCHSVCVPLQCWQGCKTSLTICVHLALARLVDARDPDALAKMLVAGGGEGQGQALLVVGHRTPAAANDLTLRQVAVGSGAPVQRAAATNSSAFEPSIVSVTALTVWHPACGLATLTEPRIKLNKTA